jgi:hypothetical protein
MVLCRVDEGIFAAQMGDQTELMPPLIENTALEAKRLVS